MKNGFLHYFAGICFFCGLGAGATFAALPEGVVTLYDRVTDTTPEIKGTGKLIAGPVWAHEGPVEVPKGTFILFR